MNRLFWLAVGAVLGVFGYRYYRQQGGTIPSLESIGHKLQNVDVDQLSQSMQRTARDAASSVQQHTRAMVEETKRTGAMSSGQAKEHASAVKDDVVDAGRRLHEDVSDQAGSQTVGQ